MFTDATVGENLVVVAKDPVVVVHVDDQVHSLGAVCLCVQLQGICN